MSNMPDNLRMAALNIDSEILISVQTFDSEILKVPAMLMAQAGIFRQMYQDLSLADSKEEFVFPVGNITAGTMRKVVEWMEMHIGKDDPVIKEDPLTRQRQWFQLSDEEKQFLNVSHTELVAYVTAANFLDLKSLYLYGCQTIAALLKNSTPENIREMFGLEDDLTPEEKEEIRRDNIWCNY